MFLAGLFVTGFPVIYLALLAAIRNRFTSRTLLELRNLAENGTAGVILFRKAAFAFLVAIVLLSISLFTNQEGITHS